MKKMKKVVSLTLAAVMAMGLMSSCNSSSDGGSKDEMKKIGVIQLLEHPAMDESYQGFVDGLKEAGYEDGKNIKIDRQNAQNEQANCVTIANKLVNDQSDLILAIATPAAQAVANATNSIPILATAVTDFKDAGIVNENDAPGTNVTGTSDLTPVKEQFDLLKRMFPDAKKVGLLYCSGETNSIFQINLAKEAAADLNLETVDATCADSNEIQQVVQSLVGKVDVIYTPTDNLIANGMANVTAITTPAGIPVIVGEEGMVSNGGLATYGINYYNLGKLTAKQAVKILKGEAEPATMPVEYLTDCDLCINETVAASLNITIPEDMKAEAKLIK